MLDAVVVEDCVGLGMVYFVQPGVDGFRRVAGENQFSQDQSVEKPRLCLDPLNVRRWFQEKKSVVAEQVGCETRTLLL